MKIKLVSVLFAVIIILLASCGQKTESETVITQTQSVNTDSLINQWNKFWNEHDSTGLTNLFNSNSVVVFSSKKRFTGANDIMKNWISQTLPVMKNLKTEKISAASTNEMAYYNGTYTLDITRNDSVIGTDAGCFNIVWKLQDKTNWKVELLFFGVNPQ